MPHEFDIDLDAKDVSNLTSADALAALLTKLGYDTGSRKEFPATALGLSADTASSVKRMEWLAQDDEDLLRVLFVQLKSVTAKVRNELARNLAKRAASDYMMILTRDFEVIEFDLVVKERAEGNAPGGGPRMVTTAMPVTIIRKDCTARDLAVLRRFTWTQKDGLAQYDKLKSVFEWAKYSEQYFHNRALFADHYLETRVRESDAWKDNPGPAFTAARDLLDGPGERWKDRDEAKIRAELFEPVWKMLGFAAKANKGAKSDAPSPDYILNGPDGKTVTAAFVYHWERWLDGPDLGDPHTPEENPGAAVVSALTGDQFRWVIVTNGKYWRLYSRDAHSRATNFYEVDLVEALRMSGDTDPNEAFRYWWLFFRVQAFIDTGDTDQPVCWLDTIVQGSREYAKRLGDRLKDRVFGVAYKNRSEPGIFAHLAQGFLQDRRKRLEIRKAPTEDELRDTFEATLTLLYRLLFLLYAESRDLLPVAEAPYKEASLQLLKKEIARNARDAESAVPERIEEAYSATETKLYDRLARLCAVMDQGDSSLNVPRYNGGLFIATKASLAESHSEREQRIARFLLEHKVPDRFLALAIDRLARDVDDKTLGLAPIDYKSLEVRHLGSIYEGLLEFKLKIADEDLTTKVEKKREKFIPLAKAKAPKGKKSAAAPVVRKGEVYLSNDKAERKASGSYYTPDPIVEYIVEHTVGPVLTEKLDALAPELRDAGKTFHRHLANAKKHPLARGEDPRAFAARETYNAHKSLVDKVFDFKVLDPAMGSGHFLVEAVDFITDRLLDFLNRFPNNPVQFALDRTRRSILDALREQGVNVDTGKLTDINLLKRHVLKRCIYGVDLNPMAVELAKVSLWLDAFTLGAPLSFLDHHLRCGNSLIGESEISEHVLTGTQREAELCRAIHNMIEIARSADARPEDAAASKTLFAEKERLAAPFRNRLHLETAKHFLDKSAERHLALAQRFPFDAKFDPSSPPAQFQEAAVVYADALRVAQEHRFFHWELEFPEVFYGFADVEERRLKHRNDIAAGAAGFNAVIGNPPWGRAGTLDELKRMSLFGPIHDDSSECFVCLAVRLLATLGQLGEVLPDTILSPAKRKIRAHLLTSASTVACYNLGPDWFTSEVRMSTVMWIASGHDHSSEDYIFKTGILPIILRRDCQNGGITLSDAVSRITREANTYDCFDEGEYSIPLFGDVGAVDVMSRAFSGAVSLSALCNHGRGVELNKAGEVFACPACGVWDAPPRRDSDGGYQEKTCSHCASTYEVDHRAKSRVLVSDAPQRSGVWKPYVDGDSIRRYDLPQYKYIDTSAKGINYKDPSSYQSPKILIRQAGIGVSAIIDTRDAYCPQSVYMYHVKDEYRAVGIDEFVVISMLCSRLFHLQVFMTFGEIDSTRAFAKLTHTRLASLRVLDPKIRVAMAPFIHRIRDLSETLNTKGLLGHESEDWEIEACWTGILGLSMCDVESIIRNYSQVHANETLLGLFPGGVSGHESKWLNTWVQAAKRCDVEL